MNDTQKGTYCSYKVRIYILNSIFKILERQIIANSVILAVCLYANIVNATRLQKQNARNLLKVF